MATDSLTAAEQLEASRPGRLLLERIHEVHRRAWRQVAANALSRTLGVSLIAFWIVGFLDWQFRWQTPLLRVGWSLTAYAVAVSAGIHWLLPLWRWPYDDVDIARNIERGDPRFGRRLSSAVAFLTATETSPQGVDSGSYELQRALIRQVESESEAVSFRDSLTWSASKRSWLFVAAALALVLTSATLGASTTWLAARRAVRPWAAPSWPRRHILRLEGLPERLIQGQPLKASLTDQGGQLPELIDLWVWPEGVDASQAQRRRLAGKGRRVQFQWNDLATGFRIRATGGDDQQMEWKRVDVVAPVEIQELTLQVVPPPYTRKQPYQSGSIVEALQGSRLEVMGKLVQPVQRVQLMSPTNQAAQVTTGQLGSDGRTFSFGIDAPWLLNESGNYQFVFEDAEGLQSASRVWPIRVRVDQPPQVERFQPVADLTVTRRAQVPIEVLVRDDQGLDSLSYTIEWSTEQDDRDEQRNAASASLVLWQADDQDVIREIAVEPTLTFAEFSWFREELDYTLSVFATDLAGQRSEPAVRRLRVRAEADVLRDLARRHSLILASLTQIVQRQQETADMTARALSDSDAPSPSPRLLDRVRQAELLQRQVARELVGAPDSALAEVQRVVAELRMNQLQDTDLMQTTRFMESVLGELSAGPLHSSQALLGNAATSVELQLAGDDPTGTLADAVRAALRDAQVPQNQILTQLESLLTQVREDSLLREVLGELSTLRSSQQELRDETQSLELRSLAATTDDVVQAARRAAEQQRKLSAAMGDLIQKLSGQAEQVPENERSRIGELLQWAVQRTLQIDMVEAAGDLDVYEFGQAGVHQQRALESLDQMLRQVRVDKRNSSRGALRQVVSRLREAERLLQRVHSELADAQGQRWQPRQAQVIAELIERFQRLAQELKRLDRAGDARQASELASQLSEARAANQAGDAERARQKVQQALAGLEQLTERLAAAAQAAGEPSSMPDESDRLRSLLAQLVELSARQTEQLAELRKWIAASDDRNAPQAESVATWRGRQLEIANTLDEQILTQLEPDDVFFVGLSRVSAQMKTAIRAVDQRGISPDLLDEVEALADSIKRLIEILEAEFGGEPFAKTPRANEGAAGSQQDARPPNDDPNSRPIDVARIKYILYLQESLNADTAAVEARTAAQPVTEEGQRAIEQLRLRQSQLARLLERVISESLPQAGDRPLGNPDRDLGPGSEK